MKSFIKIYGPPVLRAVKVLEKIAADTPEVCIKDIISADELHPLDPSQVIYNNLTELGYPVTIEHCEQMVSKSGESLGDHDFYFEWSEDADKSDVNDLIQRIDEAFEPLGCKYTITTKR